MTRHVVARLLLLVTLTSVASSQARSPARVLLPSNVMEGHLVTKVQPVYPGDAKIQGTVVLKVIIDTQGNVSNIQAISGHPMLIPSAIEAVKQWKYKPYLLKGVPIEAATNVTVNFALADKPAEGTVGSVPGGIPEGQQGGIVLSNPNEHTVAASPQPSLGTPQRVRVSQAVEQGLLVTKVAPQYPQDAKDQHVEGLVVMRVTIDKEGNVANIQLISGHPLLAPPAIDAVTQWKYRPYLLNQIPVEVETQVTVNFTLMP